MRLKNKTRLTKKVFLLFASLFICTMGLADNYPLSKEQLAAKIAGKQQLTEVPTIYIDIPSITNEQELNAQLYKNRSTGEAPYLNATITVVDNSPADSPQHLESFTDSELKIKVRGNSTASVGNGKRPYRLKFTKKEKAADGLPHKHDLLGLGYAKRNWTLLANAADKSLIRNAVTYHLGKYLGMNFCPGYKFVDLVVCGMYRGTYQVSDHCEADQDRIDVDEKKGWFLEMVEWNNMTEEPCITSDIPRMTNIKNPDTEKWSTAQIDSLKNEVRAWEKQWYNAFFSNSTISGWQALNDVESMVNFITATELTGDYDGYFVMKGSRDNGQPFKWGPLWDKDLAYGNFGQVPQGKMVADYGKTGFEDVFKTTWRGTGLFSNKRFLNLFKERFEQVVDDGLYEHLCHDIDSIARAIASTRLQNYDRWNIGENVAGEAFNMADYDLHVQQIKDFLKDRIDFIRGKIDEYYASLPQPETAVYNPQNAWWGTGLSLNKEYSMSIANRSLKGGQWNTFCLPFDATEEQMRKSMGCNYELAVHTGMDADGRSMLFDTPASRNIASGVPYLIKPEADVDSWGTFEEVTYSANVNNGSNAYNGDGVTFDQKHYFYASLFCGYNISASTDYLFDGDVYADDHSLTKATTDHQNGCRAFVRVPSGESPQFKWVEHGGQGSEEEEEEEADGNLDYDMAAVSAPDLFVEHNGRRLNLTLANDVPFKAGEWRWACFPFFSSEKHMNEALGDDSSIFSLHKVEMDSGMIKLVFHEADKNIEAGMPYLVRTTHDVAHPTFKNILFQCIPTSSIGLDGCTFQGVLEPTTTSGPVIILKDGETMLTQDAVNLNGGEAFIQLPEAVAKVKRVAVVVKGSDAVIE